MLRFVLVLISFGLLSTNGSAASEEAVYAPQAPAPTPGFGVKTTANFTELRHTVLELIGSSKRRVWLITDYLTDGDVVSALFLAKYRKVDVKVLLGRDRQNHYLSRLNYLKAQDIPVFIRPEHGFVAPTMLFVDRRLYTINRDLNVLTGIKPAQINQASPNDVKNFVTWFRDAIDYPEPASSRPDVPAVHENTYPRPMQIPDEPESPTIENKLESDDDGSYNYNRSNLPRRAPQGVPTRLPKVPVWQKNRELRLKNSMEPDPESIDAESQGSKSSNLQSPPAAEWTPPSESHIQQSEEAKLESTNPAVESSKSQLQEEQH